ncbi:hypothetical protein KFK09_017262 [Dendrobium nobile]|uniref:Uncharacterized protein n=1 Tax=Dendrobium nobile TaxID=94219 RepID=A0A8T3B6X8_DENNO|nr:hypothetical protein KFK09_017262 [Dendrobium nobile]
MHAFFSMVRGHPVRQASLVHAFLSISGTILNTHRCLSAYGKRIAHFKQEPLKTYAHISWCSRIKNYDYGVT